MLPIVIILTRIQYSMLCSCPWSASHFCLGLFSCSFDSCLTHTCSDNWSPCRNRQNTFYSHLNHVLWLEQMLSWLFDTCVQFFKKVTPLLKCSAPPPIGELFFNGYKVSYAKWVSVRVLLDNVAPIVNNVGYLKMVSGMRAQIVFFHR